MNLLNLKTAGLVLVITAASCSSDKVAQLDALKKKHDKIAEQISILEKEIAESDTLQATEGKSLKVAILEVKPSVFDHFIEVQGKLDGEENIGISARTMGTVDAVYVSMGDRVKKGQILAQLDDEILQQSLKQMKDNLVFVNELYEKQSKLWEQKIGSEVQYLSAKNNKESLENSIKTLEDQIDMARIVSPVDGTVEEISLRIGASVAPGFPVFRVVNFNSMKVVADIAEAYSARVNKGDQVIVHFPDLQKDFKANISSASKYISTQNRTFQVEVRMKPETDNFKANMIAILKVNDYHMENAISLPINLIQYDKEGSYVFIAEKGNPSHFAKKVKVKTGQTYNGTVEIVDGLKTGDLLITAGHLDVQDGEKVRL